MKKIIKKTVSLILALTMIMSLSIPLTVSADHDYVSGKYTYAVSGGTAMVTGYSDSQYVSAITIPSTLGGYQVTSISRNAFKGCTWLTSIALPDSITSISGTEFSGCTGLTTISVDSGNTVYYSENNCIIRRSNKELVSGCKTSIIPNDVTSIGGSAFYGCTVLTSITIPESVTSIGFYSFYGCTNLTSITIPESVTSILDGAFDNCNNLSTVYYGGTTIQKDQISIVSGNSPLTSAEWIYSNPISSVSLYSLPVKTLYLIGESFDSTGLELNVSFSDGTSAVITNGYTVSGFSSDTVGTKTVTVSYYGFSSVFGVKVKQVSGISILNMPTKTVYEVGESLDTTGLELTASYNDGTSGTITSGYTVSGFSSALGGMKTVTVSYGGISTNFQVEVIRRATALSVNTLPAKTLYSIGDQFNAGGLTLTRSYNDGTTETITEGYDVSGFSSGSEGIISVTVTHGELSTSIDVEIVNSVTG